MEDYSEYRDEIIADIESTVGSKPVQPIIFAGSGLSMRYFSGPDWDGLLSEMAGKCPKLNHNYGYYRQNHSPAEMGQLLSDWYAQWAWDQNESKFEELDMDYQHSADLYLKTEIANYFDEITPQSIEEITEDSLADELELEQALQEIDKLRNIQPHAIITTNYDEFLEVVFNQDEDEEFEEDKYNVVVGEELIGAQQKSIGEILKIHGSASDPETLILTTDDYETFNRRKRYLSSKMLTYFAEHPILIVGYSASDPNVRKILSWMNQVLPDDEEVAKDIYFVQYTRDISELEEYRLTKRIQLGEERSITVKQIIARDFDWIFEAFASGDGFPVDVRSLRKLLANTYDVVRSKTPDTKVVDVKRVEDVSADSEQLATVLGIAVESGKVSFQFDHNYRPNEFYDLIGVGSARGFKKEVLVPIWEQEEVNITQFNNKYHIAFYGTGAVEPRIYSDRATELAEQVMEGEEFELGIPEEHIPDEDILEGRGLDLSTVMDDSEES